MRQPFWSAAWVVVVLTHAAGQGGVGYGIRGREVFFLNLEDGYFGCQVNESKDVLQLYELSKLCDGKRDCYHGSDELAKELKCTKNCGQQHGNLCQNGACLDSQCHCNDGFGGCDCQVPDENECKYRPCDVFAHCTNTLGSFHCTCFPGYTGNGFYCQDIDECANPAIAARCVENAECCNFPAHFMCKCKPGFHGDGEVECTDINECELPNACGINTLCINTPGNYSCDCETGYRGNPYNGCVDINECDYKEACGPGAFCSNLPGEHRCECPQGFEGDAYQSGCVDINECLLNACGINAICVNEPGTFRCSCPPGFAGDPFSACTDIDECETSPCGLKAECINKNGSYSCKCLPGYSGEAEKECTDINECSLPNQCGINAKCFNTLGSYTCVCPHGFSGHGHIFCENIDECKTKPCGENAQCTDAVGSFVCSCLPDYTGDPYKGCTDIDECSVLDKPCGQNAICENTNPGFTCNCPQGFAAKPHPTVACEQVDVSILCEAKRDCVDNAECIDGQCFCLDGFKEQGSLCVDIDECLSYPCGPFSTCNNTQGSFHCGCLPGNVGAPPKIPCKAPCDDIKCGKHAFCKSNEQEAYCICEEGWTFSPEDVSAGCIDINECDPRHGPFGQCGANAVCFNSLGSFNCECQPGYSGNPFKQCADIDECSQNNPCGLGAICKNTPGSYECSCPPDWLPDPDPATKCVPILTCKVDSECPGNAVCYNNKFCHCPEPNVGSECTHPCDSVKCSQNAECAVVNNEAVCSCSSGYTGVNAEKCVDINECSNNPCPTGAICHNEPGSFSCRCPGGTVGDPFKQGCSQAKIPVGCGPENPCPGSELCIRDDTFEESICICQRGYLRDAKTDKCRDINECTELRDKPVCGLNAVCKNLPGSYDCQCPLGFNGNPFNLCEECNSLECQCRHPYQLLNGECVLAGCDNGLCPNGAECISIPGGVSYCACPKGFRRRDDGKCEDIDECKEIAQACGLSAECVNKKGSYECICNQGTTGDPYLQCSPAQIKCFNHNDCLPNEQCIHPGECVCPPPYISDALDGNKCKSPCEMLHCGANAECKSSDPPRCLCRPGFTGDPLTGCTDIDECLSNPCMAGAQCINENGSYKCGCPKGVTGEGCTNWCSSNPCGANSRCRDVNNGYECSCLPGCSGDPIKGCLCETTRVDSCNGHTCGKNAFCRIRSGSNPECYCPLEFPLGNPEIECTVRKIPIDCRVSGCGKGAHCVLHGSSYSCQCPPGTVGNPDKDCIPEKECSSDNDCLNDKTCTNHQCLDVCSVKGACGLNALCEPVNHKPKCSCPSCYIGVPKTGCYRDTNCSSLSSQKCSLNSDCPSNLTCIDGYCKNPCLYIDNKNILNCTNHKKCHVQNHKPVCICETGYSVNEFGDLICSPDKMECFNSDDCPSNLTCIKNKCSDPCSHIVCPQNKTCVVLTNQPICVCTKDCQPSSFFICMRDAGCPKDLACRNYLCTDPCSNFSCPARSPCHVEDHKPVCKFCPVGFSPDSKFGCIKAVGCVENEECALNMACINNQCQNPCHINNPCTNQHDCQVQNHHSICVKVCSCHRNSNCGPNHICDGCHCVIDPSRQPLPLPGCEHCPPGVRCDPFTGACMKMNGTAKRPHPCQSDSDCLEIEACYDGQCGDLCALAGMCAPTATCHVYKHRPVCTCPPGHEGDPAVKCFLPKPLSCVTNADCSFTEACIQQLCQHPCEVHNPCAQNAVCSNVNHGTTCTCIEGFRGNALVGCTEVKTYQPICQYNGDCPPDRVCDRMNRICVNPCSEDSCGEFAECVAINHGSDCRCLPGYHGNPYIGCSSVTGCHSNEECNADEACMNGKCSNPCHCGPNAVCDVIFHEANCKCLPGYSGNPNIGCIAPSDPCNPNPCGYQASCEVDNGNPICFCPKGMTGNPFKTCIPEGDECSPNPCGPFSGCRVVKGTAVCYCLPEYEGDPPSKPCHLPENPCNPSPCGPNTQCSLLNNGFAKCTCLPGYVESLNTIRGCVEKVNPCEPNPCGHGAVCNPNQAPSCFCPEPLVGNPYRSCSEPLKTMCQPGPCGLNADCYVTGGAEQCFCKPGYTGDPYSSCDPPPSSPCTPSPCGPFASCSVSPDGKPLCFCLDGMAGDPYLGCSGPECRTNKDCPWHKACVGWKCQDPCPGACGIGSFCQAEKHHPVCLCENGSTGNPLIRCAPMSAVPPVSKNPCQPNPCGLNTLCSIVKNRAVCSCLPDFVGDPQSGCKPECVLNSDCPSTQACISHHCKDPCSFGNICGVGAECVSKDHTVVCICPRGSTGDPFIQCISSMYLPVPKNGSLLCHPSPCDSHSVCSVHDGRVVMCDPCASPDGYWSPSCHPECMFDSDCAFNLACIGQKCINPCSGSCGLRAQCIVHHHQPICSCPQGLVGNPYEQCQPPDSTGTDLKKNSCDLLQCGANAVCKISYGHTACVCSHGYHGNPYLACRPECVLNTDCASTMCCINNKCTNPCIGACGVNAHCQAVNHLPICFCPADHSGDPFVSCYPSKQIPPDWGNRTNPCDPSPCGPNSRCLTSSQGYPACSCLPGYRGVPPVCKPECVISAECPQSQACLNQKCADPCPGTCGINSKCDTMNHNPICSCPPGHVGDPFVSCYLPPGPEIPKINSNPCEPSPCGPNSICQVTQGHPVCSCATNYTGKPPYCRPECLMSQECPHDKACIQEKCRNPCTRSCGFNAKCNVINHTPFCTCLPGYEGDAFVGCSSIPPTVHPEVPTDPCVPSPCGENSQCSSVDGTARCTCIPPYLGDPYTGGCRPECVISSDCPPHQTCLSSYCRDPCPEVCDVNAQCFVVNHVPQCSCLPGYSGDPFVSCKVEPPKSPPSKNPCEPTACGPNSICRVVNGHALCSCQSNYIGSPPHCRPECILNAECDQNRACIQQKCRDPCPESCGEHAVCQVINHNPICKCPSSTFGDPLVKCFEKVQEPTEKPTNPCVPSPCGANSECHLVDHRVVCSCLPGMLGAPPFCRPECSINADCPTKLACMSNKCHNPCKGFCGINSQCSVVNHRAVCSCFDGYEGDPLSRCEPVQASERTPVQTDPCFPSPCGTNSECISNNGAAVCVCSAGFQGDPYTSCHRECESNKDCAASLICTNFKCTDPCPGPCGKNSICTVLDHVLLCSCLPGFAGDPFLKCSPISIPPSTPTPPTDPCNPSPCGPNSLCKRTNGQAVCSCLPHFIGSPPNCHAECNDNQDCAFNKACINHKCANPCSNTCGINAQCTVKNHSPICTCPPKHTGDPFIQCSLAPIIFIPPTTKPTASCYPSPCGPHSQCQIVENKSVCSCLSGFIGSPPHCRPECVISAECSSHLACIQQRCQDPCLGSCGVDAQCHVQNHIPICACMDSYTGDPFTLCQPIILSPSISKESKDSCASSPCGANAECKNGICSCVSDYVGNPYEECRPECFFNQECNRNKACMRNKCQDPCPGTCGQFSRCDVVNHIPVCSCPTDMTGDPFYLCRPLPEGPVDRKDACNPSPCGPNSQCEAVEGFAVCSCLPSYVGTPPNCKLECLVSNECSLKQACINSKCVDPCIGTCGLETRCEVINHNPVCSCKPQLTGDPFKRCYNIPLPPSIPPADEKKTPCASLPCGPNAVCEDKGDGYVCKCLLGFTGAPPKCKPECVINPDCPAQLACINQKCMDPCPDACGIGAKCQVISHSVVCSCSPGFTGNPFIHCVQHHNLSNPCEPSPCGPNAYCKQQRSIAACSCIHGYFGNPYESCRPECVLDSDCLSNKACIGNKCQDPCPSTCGHNAICSTINHVPSCTCIEGFDGDPFIKCNTRSPPGTEVAVLNPCDPSPCGLHSKCRVVNKQAVCSCKPQFKGIHPYCKPECITNNECPSNKACLNSKCYDPCVGTCGLQARCDVINHSPVCSCPMGLAGDPFSLCIRPPPVPSDNPCLPSPCGPNSACRIVNKQAACSCLFGYSGSAPNCRPECSVSTDCSKSTACIAGKCRNPCEGSCGNNANCRVQNHVPSCSCPPGYSGDPFFYCSPIIMEEIPMGRDPCFPSPCGANADCDNGVCSCRPSYIGNPYSGCRPECTINTECSSDKACINYRCINPCIGACGHNAYCDVINHVPTCTCPPGMSGNPFLICQPFLISSNVTQTDSCQPNPCGPNSVCRIVNNLAVCSCQPSFVGSAPYCRPECVVSSECSLIQACLSNKCQDPCPGTCGSNAVCRVVNHSPICSCQPGYTGDPFRLCHPVPYTEPPSLKSSCHPSPCGPNAKCQVQADSVVCSCMTNYVGTPPHCRPICTINPECPSHLACINQKCEDPCPGTCGSNAQCFVINHSPICSCMTGFSGDPFIGCSVTQEVTPTLRNPTDPCYSSPCGPNAHCKAENSYALCECIADYQGNPYQGCRPECLVSSDCPMNLACIHNKCSNPCLEACGLSAICTVSNHVPICSCPEGTTGNSLKACQPLPKEGDVPNPCSPSPCGPNTVCRILNDVAVCECLPGFHGSASVGDCRPECVINADCPPSKACINHKCLDPCAGICGHNSICDVIGHSPVCSCADAMVGDPFVECHPISNDSIDPCYPSPCRQNGICNDVGGSATCMYPECIVNNDCPKDKACFSQKCSDPCFDACGLNALCHVINHNPVCLCPPGFTGQPHLQCSVQPPHQRPKAECEFDSDCLNDKACVSGMCRNPCETSARICGINADCHVQFHRPICTCKPGLTGDPQVQCIEDGCHNNSQCAPEDACINHECVNPCLFSKCGINAECVAETNHRARCFCPPSFTGDPLVECERPQCTNDDNCLQNLACQNGRCVNPCNCAPEALCTVSVHKPTCSCPPGYTGDPYHSCTIGPIEIAPGCKQDAECPSRLLCILGECHNPCIGIQPCGLNAECKIINTLPLRIVTCQCLPGFVGDSYVQCERDAAQTELGCKGDSECQLSEVCLNRLCVNPCAVSSPCAPTAECQADNHRALCKCPLGLIGDPFVNCYKEPITAPECVVDSDCPTINACINERCQDPCIIGNPCGAGAQCSISLHRPVCECPNGWAGDPQTQCYKSECKTDEDCVFDKACVENNCVNPCRSISCGRGAECQIQAHHASCICPVGTQGDPLISCIGVICQYNEDCADHEACDRANHKCRPVCQENTCATNAFCSAANHQSSCTCAPGTQGNPYAECSKPRLPVPLCSQDSDCPSKLACINQRCENPCLASHVCTKEQECRVLDTLPLRSVICECPSDTIATPDGNCKSLAALKDAKCRSSEECRNNEKCFKGTCTDVCRVEPCGVNAQCIGRKHQAMCSCPLGYIGNAHFECSSLPKIPMLPILPECTKDRDCTFGLSCTKQRCINPCTTKVCSRNAFCHVEGHKPVCRCPPGFSGDAVVECKPFTEVATIGCLSNSDCSLQESCVNRLCISPCNCGPNADCKVIDHYPICSCLPGFSGNPQFGCVKVDCELDSQCLSSEKCYNRKCVNPCILGDVCAHNAQCYGDNHLPACRCLPGYVGNPLERCEHEECHVDSDCRSDQKCFNQHCVNPCQNFPCAPNAICYVNNHNAACRCPENIPLGNPSIYCERQPASGADPECKYDMDCLRGLACITNRCVDPCYELAPCSPTARCNVLDSVPVRTLTCSCSEGWVPNAEGECRPVVVPSPPGCTANYDCPSNETCIDRVCRNPCNCGANAKCFVQDHYPVCSCQEGFEGNPLVACRSIGCRSDSECESGKACLNSHCVDPCLVHNPCGFDAECYAVGNRAECKCASGYRGNPYDRCRVIGCRANNDCPDDRSCINGQCINPCAYEHPCAPNSECKVSNHLALCRCPPGELGNPYIGCRPEPKPECKVDADCPSKLACFKDVCQNPCTALEPCTRPAECSVVSSLPVRTMLCVCPSGYASSGSGTCKAAPPIIAIGCVVNSQCPSDKACVNAVCTSPCNCPSFAVCQIEDHKPVCMCPPGYEGNPDIECVKVECPPGKGLIRTEAGECVCPSGYALNANEECHPCYFDQGFKVDENGRCTCALDRGFIINEHGSCVCPVEYGYHRDSKNHCVPVDECKEDTDCSSKKYCNLETRTCEDPCLNYHCGVNAFCNVTNHQKVCLCIAGFSGDPNSYCNQTSGFRSDFPPSDMAVSCLSDGVQVKIYITDTGFNGVLYVKGHSKDESCRSIVSVPQEYANQSTVIFKVHFGSCGLMYVNGLADFVLVIQKHPKLVTYKAQAYHIKCVYSTGEQNVTLGFNVSMLTTAGTIANTGPPPTCIMKIVTHTGQEINSAEIGDNLMLQVDVQPSTIYGGFARTCIAKTMEDSVENEYIVTDENGCATDPSIFGEWDYHADTQSLLATFNAFKFPSSDNIRFQCNIRVCFGKCQPSNCRGYNAYGKRRRRDVSFKRRNSSDTSDALLAGQLREEIIIQSNAILTLERSEEKPAGPPDAPKPQRAEDICISVIGFIVALIVTALLALVAVTIAVSCWLLAYRRRPTLAGPLPHPPEFPNPLFTTPEPVAEPSPDYHS